MSFKQESDFSQLCELQRSFLRAKKGEGTLEEGRWAACCSNPGWVQRSSSYSRMQRCQLWGAKERIWVTRGFLALLFTRIEEKREV